jgi:ketosteroid isomerase-like protein
MNDTFQRIEDEWAAAVVGRDTETVERILADDFVLTSEGGVSDNMPREDWLAALPQIDTRSLVCSVTNVREYGSAAVVRGRLRWAATMGDRDLSGEYAVADVFTRTDDRWRASWRISVRLTHE